MNAFRIALNASTLFPFRLTLPEQIRVAAEAGYDGIEIWMNHGAGYCGFVSLELFIPDFGGRSALEVAKHGLSAVKRIYDVRQ